MANFTGFYDLVSAEDLLQKLKWEFDCLANAKTGTDYKYHAFNFFVTAYHIADWPHPADGQRLNKHKDEALIKICGHVANGAKHFATYSHVKAVRSLDEIRYVEDDYVEFGYFETLYISIDKGEVPGFELTQIGVCDLAQRLIVFWEEKIPAARGAG